MSFVCIGQEPKLDYLAHINANDQLFKSLLDAHHILPKGFFITDNHIYVGAFYSNYLFKYDYIDSTNNSQKISGFNGNGIKGNSNEIINCKLQLLNLETNDVLRIRQIDAYYSEPEYYRLSSVHVSDSVVFCFFVSRTDGGRLETYKYNLNANVLTELNLPNFAKRFMDNNHDDPYNDIHDIYVSGNTLFSLVFYRSPEKETLIAWDMQNDTELSTFSFPEFSFPYQLLSDKWDNIYVLEGLGEDGYRIFIFTQDLTLIETINVDTLLNEKYFMVGNELYDADYSGDRLVIASQNMDKQIFLMTETYNGLFFHHLNYLGFLKDYYKGLSENDLRILRNTIFAKHGRAFKTDILKDYFMKQSWYSVNPTYHDSLLSDFDRNCILFIQSFEKD